MYRNLPTHAQGADEMSSGTPASPPNCDFLVYEAPGGEVRVDVRLDRETVWLTQHQMAEIFGRDRSVVARHIRNIFKEEELDPKATCAKFAQVQSEGGRTVSRETAHFNLEVVVSVGYRIRSVRGTWFRQWAARILRDHLVRGHSLNQRRLAERGLREARESLDLLARTFRNRALAEDNGHALLAIVADYSETWRLLLDYDEGNLQMPPGTQPSVGVLDHSRAAAAIAEFKSELKARGEASALFGNPRGDAFEAILGNVEQSMFGDPLYRSLKEKAANLLYFIVKDHPFTDGNKRIGSLLFLLYLRQEGLEHDLNPKALTALTLLVAESAPSTKDLMIRLIVNLLAGPEGQATKRNLPRT